jgi:UDP-N-acetyl-D-galactosamine dehydrogenase
MNLDTDTSSPLLQHDAPAARPQSGSAPVAPAFPDVDQVRVGIIGLGYVGLPLAVEFGRLNDTVGFDLDAARIEELRRGNDRTREVPLDQLRDSARLALTASAEDLRDCDVIIVAVPTPVDDFKQPDLSPLRAASATVGRALKPGAVVVFESTVYPGCTEEVCAPIIEACSGLRLNRDFFLGYSPERINPGDHERRLPSIVKITSGSTPEAAKFVDALYARIITAGTHRAPSIRVAEAAKVIENTQRDVNIALVNELAMLFHRMGIDTAQVLQAAGTKWNFLPFRPGLVGGHCVGVDPYYLTYKAQQLGFVPEMILAGRRINDGMGAYVASRVIKLLVQRRIHAAGARILMLGLAFKENCPDLRNTRVIDIIRELREYGAQVDVHDPWADPAAARHEHGLELVADPKFAQYDAVVVAVAHGEFARWGAEHIRALCKPDGVVFDVKQLLDADDVEGRL